MNPIKLVALFVVSLGLMACGSSDTNAPTTTPNVAPTASAGTDQTVISEVSVTLSGTGSDSDGSIANYVWSQEGGTGLTLNSANTDTATFTAPGVTTATSYTLKLTVTDNDGASNSDELVITVNPIARAAGLTLPTQVEVIPD